MQFIMRSVESSSMGTVTNLDWPTRMTDAMINIAYRCPLGSIHSFQDMDTNLSTEGINLPLVAGQLREAEDELRQSTSQNRTSVEVTAKDQGYRRRGLMSIFRPYMTTIASTYLVEAASPRP